MKELYQNDKTTIVVEDILEPIAREAYGSDSTLWRTA